MTKPSSSEVDLDRLHDILVEVNGRSYSERQLLAIFETLPAQIQTDVVANGVSDSLYTHFMRRGVPTV